VLARFYICLIAFFLGIPNLQAQEEEFFDDSTKEVYSSQTTLFLTLADLKYNQANFRPITINITKGDQFTYRQRAGYKLQDLGNDGTATKPIFYTLPRQIGAHSGFYVYDIYFKDPMLFKYYDTKSPYTDGSVVLAHMGSYTFEVLHSRSLNQNWHLGASLGTMLIDKEFIPVEVPGDRNVISYPFALFGHYKTDQARYQILASFYRKYHRVRETGGIFGNKLPRNWLQPKAKIENNLAPDNSIETSDLRQQYHLYQQVNWVDELQTYHEIKLTNQFNQFKGEQLNKNKKSKTYLGGNLPIIPDSLQETTTWKTLGNEFGVKGDIDQLFYRCYYLNKKLHLQQPYQNDPLISREHYMGLQTRLKLSKQQDFLHIQGEYLLGGLYQMYAAYQGDRIELAYSQVYHKPSFLSQRHTTPFRSWEKALRAPKNQQIYGAIRLELPYLVLRPHATITKVVKPIYFVQTNQGPIRRQKDELPQLPPLVIEPKQSEGHAELFNLGTDLNFTLLSHFHADNELIFTQVQGPAAQVFRMPKFSVNTRLYYARTLYDGRLDLETGADLHWHSAYHSDGYDPATQQFYIQNTFQVYDYLLADLFFNFRINTFRGFIKLTNLAQHFPLEGYFVTPFYPGQSRSLDVGVSWSFFD
jgi:hypothetical protein